MSNENKMIPKIRFPEFFSDGEWDKEVFEDVFKRVTSKNTENNQNVLTISAQLGLVSQLEYFNKSVSAKDVGGYYLLQKGDFAYNKSYSKGYPMGAIKPLKNYEKGVVSTLYICFRAKDGYSPFFFEQYFDAGLLNSEISNIAQEGGRAHGLLNVSVKDFFRNIILLVPKPQEQQKIASCLSSLDELIAAHNDKLDALNDHKKGLLQNLFPQEGETVPKVRFPEFGDDGEWVEKKLGTVFNFLVTNSFSRALLNYEDGEVKNIHYGDIHTKFSTLFDIYREDVPYINPDVSIEKIREECYCQEGDIIFADASEDLNDVGKSIEIVNLNGELLVSGLHTLLARQIEKTLEIGFGGYLFKSDWIRKQIQREAQGAKVLGISTGRISNIKISFPRNPKEQQKIASCLSAVDELITSQQEKIEQLQQHKKGLMQGLFPKIV